MGGLRRRLRLFLGALWLFDGLLQLQPAMFTQSFPSQVLLPALQSFPEPMSYFTLGSLYPLILDHVVFFNLAVIAVQAAIGVLLLTDGSSLNRAGLILSTAWSLLIWVFGEAFGGMLAPTGGGLALGAPSLYSGFPGPALLYLYLSAALLVPEERWMKERSSRVSPIWDFAPITLFSALAAQLNPHLFTPQGQAEIFDAGLPQSLAWMAAPVAGLAQAHPVAANTLEAAWIAVAALLLAHRATRTRRVTLVVAAALFGYAWFFCMGFGGLFTGLGTDPNTPPLLFAATALATLKPKKDVATRLGYERCLVAGLRKSRGFNPDAPIDRVGHH